VTPGPVAPGPVAPGPVAPSPVAPSNADIVDQALQVLPARPEGFIPWRGLYIGLNLGGGDAHGGGDRTCVNSQTGDTTGCVVIPDSPLKATGVLGGAQFGWMTSIDPGWGTPLVAGIETDLQGTGIGSTRNTQGPFAFSGVPAVCQPCSYGASERLEWFGTFRLRLGVPIDNFLLYATGGAIYAGAAATQTVYFAGTPGYAISGKGKLAGPTVGGGIEVAIPDSPWSAKLEALYYDLGTLTTTTVAQPGFGGNFSDRKTVGFQGAIIRLGVNVRLGDIGAF
jgi:outer membrane immunogenic protein